MITLADVPSAVVKPKSKGRSVTRKALVRREFNRRSFIRGIVAIAGAGTLVSLEQGLTRVGAVAAPPTYGSCAAYYSAQISHYGTAYKNGVGRWWAVCNPYASDVGGGNIGWGQIGVEFCNSTGYHRTDSICTGSGDCVHHVRRATSCAGKNAWAWKVSLDTQWQNKHSRRCSDGQRYYSHDGVNDSRVNTACSKKLPGFDPPAAAIEKGQYTPDRCDPDVEQPENC